VESAYATKMPDRQFRGGGAKVSFSLKQPQHNLLHQLLGGRPSIGGHTRKLRFLLRSEMDFHRLQDNAKGSLAASSKFSGLVAQTLVLMSAIWGRSV